MKKNVIYLIIFSFSFFIFLLFYKGLLNPKTYFPNKINNKKLIEFSSKNLFSDVEINSSELMSIFKSDKQLNISDKYLSPGFAYGGSCLPKDTNGLKNLAKSSSISVPIISSIEISNNHLIQHVADEIKKLSPKKILIFGITFKKGTDDLRGSPIIELSRLLDLNKFDFIDDKVVDDKLSFNNTTFIKKDYNFLVEDYDLIILNYATLTDELLSKIYQCKAIFDLNNSLEHKSNITKIT